MMRRRSSTEKVIEHGTWEDKLTVIDVRICGTRMRINRHTRIRAPVEAKYVEWMRRVNENPE